MIDLKKTDCCGCGACAFACPVDAIEMKPDENGFIYPVFDTEKCISCSLCDRTCVYGRAERKSPDEVYAAVGRCDLSRSASGGMFASFAEAFVSDGGAVFGAALTPADDGFISEHRRAEHISDLDALKGSKYVQSDISGAYPEIRACLDNGKRVLFSGTPCQCAAVKDYFESDLLYTVELVCHGVPSNELFNKFIAYEEKKRGRRITAFRFRTKKAGWGLTAELTFADGKKEYIAPEYLSYYQLFLDGKTYRENCYTCPYASDKRGSDVTIGDFWNIELSRPDLLTGENALDPEKGISCLCINTEKGRELLESYGSCIIKHPASYGEASRYNGQMTRPSARPTDREKILALAKDYSDLDRAYRRSRRPIRAKNALRRAVPRPLKSFLKKILK